MLYEIAAVVKDKLLQSYNIQILNMHLDPKGDSQVMPFTINN